MHRFSVGQLVRLSLGSFPNRSSGSYTVLRQLPETHGELYYRIKSVHDQKERAVREADLGAAA